MSTRYRLLSVSGRRIKVRRWAKYIVNIAEDLTLEFQEQREDGYGVHTHVWFLSQDLDLMFMLYDVILELKGAPKRLDIVGISTFVSRTRDGEGFEEPDAQLEFVFLRKLSQTLVDEVCEWIQSLLDELVRRVDEDETS